MDAMDHELVERLTQFMESHGPIADAGATDDEIELLKASQGVSRLPADLVNYLKLCGWADFEPGIEFNLRWMFEMKTWVREDPALSAALDDVGDDVLVFWASQGCNYLVLDVSREDTASVYQLNETGDPSIRVATSFSEFIHHQIAALRDSEATHRGSLWIRGAWDRNWASKPVTVEQSSTGLERVNGAGTFRVTSTGMAPTLTPGQEIHVRESVDVSRTDVVVFVTPDDTGDVWVKRIVGLGGETVSVREGCVEIDGHPLGEPYVNGEYDGTPDFAPCTVPNGAVFLLGDHRYNSWDSRVFGPIDASAIIGVVDLSNQDDP
jgi:signal peptidase I